MSDSDLLPVNFTISPAAKRAIEQVRREHDAQFSSDPAAMLWIGWGIYMRDSNTLFEKVVIGFYTQSELPGVAHGIQEVSGLKFIFFTMPEYHSNFEGKILDHTDKRGFFLRNP